MDVGGTKVSVVITDRHDRVAVRARRGHRPSSIAGQIAGLVDDARRELGQDLAAVGVAIPGHVDPDDGSVRMAVNLGITHLPLGPMVEAELGVPTFVEHDARAAALWLSGQPAAGSAIGAGSLAFLAIGTGISAGVVLDGALLRGDNRFAGEVGHIVADPDGVDLRVRPAGLPGDDRRRPGHRPPGRRGRGRRSGARCSRPIRRPPTCSAPVPPATTVAAEITDRVADHLARAIRALALTLGVKRVVIGGGVAAAGAALLDPIQSRIARERAASPLVEAALGDASIELLPPTVAPGARGAAAIARHRVDLPEREGVGER